MSNILLVTTESIIGKEITNVLGLVHSASVQSKNIFSDFGQGFKSIVGGKLNKYTNMIESAKYDAIEIIKKLAAEMGANAIVGLRFSSTNTTMGGSAEIVAYGTAVNYE